MIFKRKKENEKTPKEILSSFSRLEEKMQRLELLIEDLKKENEKAIQKIGIVRFNPFSNTGGDQSFSLALLDGKNNGIVITSFYSREGSNVYGKPIKNGKSTYVLSEEEKKAIEKAEEEDILIGKEKEIKNKNQQPKLKKEKKSKKP